MAGVTRRQMLLAGLGGLGSAAFLSACAKQPAKKRLAQRSRKQRLDVGTLGIQALCLDIRQLGNVPELVG